MDWQILAAGTELDIIISRQLQIHIVIVSMAVGFIPHNNSIVLKIAKNHWHLLVFPTYIFVSPDPSMIFKRFAEIDIRYYDQRIGRQSIIQADNESEQLPVMWMNE